HKNDCREPSGDQFSITYECGAFLATTLRVNGKSKGQGEHIMKRNKMVWTAAAALAVMTQIGSAQSGGLGLTAKVPFAFQTPNGSMQKGSYGMEVNALHSAIPAV